MALTEKDLRAIGELISEKIDAGIESKVPGLIKAEMLGLATSEELMRLAEIVRGMTTNEVTAANQDQVMGELQAIRQEHAMLNNRVRNHEDRITDLEEIHPGGDHAS